MYSRIDYMFPAPVRHTESVSLVALQCYDDQFHKHVEIYHKRMICFNNIHVGENQSEVETGKFSIKIPEFRIVV